MLSRALALVLVLGVWLGVAGVGGPLVGRLSEVQRNDNASFLPETAESTEVAAVSARFSDAEPLPFFVVFERDGGLTSADQETVADFVASLPELPIEVSQVGDTTDGQARTPLVGDYLADQPIAPVPSQDGEAALVVVSLDAAAADALIDGESAIFKVAEALREATPSDRLENYVTGPAGVLADFVTVFSGIDGRLLQVTTRSS